MLAGDRKSAWEPGALPDRRVRHWWDADRVAGKWFAGYLGSGASAASGVGGPKAPYTFWDGYVLFGPEAQWDAAGGPAPIVGYSIGTVIGDISQLKRHLLTLLGRP